MAVLRWIGLFGGAIAAMCGLAAITMPAQAPVLGLAAALGGGLAMATLFLLRPAARTGDTLPATPPPPSTSGVAAKPAESGAHAESRNALMEELTRYKALEQELTRAKQEAEAATMAKGEFLATMSHEIRTPLNGVIPLLDLLLSTPLDTDQRDYLTTAYGSAQQLLRIVDDILDYSKLDANKLQLENVGINLRDLGTGVLRLLDKSAEGKGLKLSLDIEPSVRLAMRGDPVRLRQILTNLVSNAIKFTERGSITVRVRRIGETRTRNQLRFEVADTGIGITPDAAARLFQPFSQADASTTRTFGGTGLGLAICKRIVTLMGGRIGVESTPGHGSTFWFEIALDKALGDIQSRSATTTPGTQRALLVTANATQQTRLSSLLQQAGMVFVHAGNTQEALAKLRSLQRPGQRGFDLVLVDAASIPTTLLALHRSLIRETQPSQTCRIYLSGEEAVPKELAQTPGFHVLARASADTELRSRIGTLLDARPEEDDAPVLSPPPASVPAPGKAPRPASPPMSDVPAGTVPSPARPPAPPTTPVATTPAPATPTPFPQKPAALPAGTAPFPPPEPIPGMPVSRRVLLVEDNPVNRQVAQRLLSLAGIAFDSAENGKEAVEKMGANHYAAVLMDCQMPIMDGYAATRQRRLTEQQHHMPRLPIIAMTANAMLGDREKCLEAGMDDYLTKPLNRALLESTLGTWMSGTATPAVPTPSPTTPLPPTRKQASATPVAAPTGPALDHGILDELREVMGGEFSMLVRVFLDDAPRIVERLQTLAAQGELAAIAAPAHTLKSTSANLGALGLSAQAKALELDARQGSLVDADIKAAALELELERVSKALRSYIETAS